MNSATPRSNRLWQWLPIAPIPLLLAMIAGLWVADLRTVYESRVLMIIVTSLFVCLFIDFCWRNRDKAAAYEREAALQESQEKLEFALRAAAMGAWRLDLRYQKRHYEAQTCRCLGIDPERFGGTTGEFFAAVHPDDLESVKSALDRSVATGEPTEVEYRAIWPDGSVRHIASRGQLTHDAAGQPLSIDGVLWDITERKHSEDRLRRSEEQH